MIAKDFEDKRIQTCFTELMHVFADYSLQQQKAASELEKTIIEPLKAFRRKFNLANKEINKKGEIVFLFIDK